MRKANVFVYGTLRAGEYNDGGFTATAAKVIEGCAKGRMWNVRGNSPVYPVVQFDEGQDTWVVGDLLVDIDLDSPRFEAVARMELGAGYTPKDVLVYDDFGRVLGSAIAFHYPRDPRGCEILGGDWLAWKANVA